MEYPKTSMSAREQVQELDGASDQVCHKMRYTRYKNVIQPCTVSGRAGRWVGGWGGAMRERVLQSSTTGAVRRTILDLVTMKPANMVKRAMMGIGPACEATGVTLALGDPLAAQSLYDKLTCAATRVGAENAKVLLTAAAWDDKDIAAGDQSRQGTGATRT